jgi:hypothetical protein
MARTFVAAAGVLAALLLTAGCGSDESPRAAAPSEPAATAALEQLGDTEAEYNLPPPRARGRMGETLTADGSNLGVRLAVTVTGVADPVPGPSPPAGKRYVGVELRLRNTGIAVFEAELRDAVLTYEGGRARPAFGVKAECSNGLHELMRLDVDRRRRGCVVFALPEGERPRAFQLALEEEPVADGPRWRLR